MPGAWSAALAAEPERAKRHGCRQLFADAARTETMAAARSVRAKRAPSRAWMRGRAAGGLGVGIGRGVGRRRSDQDGSDILFKRTTTRDAPIPVTRECGCSPAAGEGISGTSPASGAFCDASAPRSVCGGVWAVRATMGGESVANDDREQHGPTRQASQDAERSWRVCVRVKTASRSGRRGAWGDRGRR